MTFVYETCVHSFRLLIRPRLVLSPLANRSGREEGVLPL